MKSVSCQGDYFGKFNIVNNESTTSLTISGFDSKLYNVKTLFNNRASFIEYVPGATNNSFTNFDPSSGYLVLAKDEFVLNGFRSPNIISSLNFSGDPIGIYTIFRYPFVTSLPLSTYNNFLYEVKTTSQTKDILRTYVPTNALNPFEYFEFNNYYIVKAKQSFTINNPDPSIRSDMQVGSITAGEVVPGGSTLEQFAEQLLTVIFEPTFVAPTFTVTNNRNSIESGTIGVTLTLNFNRGSIVGALTGDSIWAPTAIQGFRSGVVTTYNLSAGDARTTASGTFGSFVIPDGTTTFTASANYAQGPQPLNNRNQNFSTPLPAGQLTNSTTVIGRRNAFWGVNSAGSTSNEIRALSNSLLNPGNGSTFTINIPSGTTSVVFAYPSTLRDVNSVKYVEGLNAEVKGIFGSPSLINVEGANGYTATQYKVYRYQPVEAFSATATYNVTI